MRMLLIGWMICLLGLTGTAAAQPQEEAPAVTAYRGAALLDIGSGAWRRGQTLVIEGERIAAIQPDSAPLPEGATLVDMAGRYAIPGLIDAHQHYGTGLDERTTALASRAVHSGVVAIRDMAGDARILARLARDARLGLIDSPDIFYAALMAGPSFLADDRVQNSREGVEGDIVPWLQPITPETDLALAVAMVRGTGASGIKIYANLPPDLVQAIAAEAHRQGVPVWAHGAIFPTTPMEAVAAGADTLSHVCMLAYQIQHPPPASYDYADRPALDEAALMAAAPDAELAALYAAMREAGTVLDTTLYVYRTIERMRAEIGEEDGPPTYCSSRLAEHLAHQAYAAGVTMAAGTDAPAPPDQLWPALFEELELLRDEAGLAPIDLLRSATVNAALAIGRTDMGALEPGMLANVAFLTADPLDPASELRSVELTVKRGRQYWRRDYAQGGAVQESPLAQEVVGS